MPEVKRLYGVVCGRGQFPFDMLRYDCAFPDTSDDAVILGESIEHDYERVRVLIVAKYDKMGHFTLGRWASFGWTCREFKDRYEAIEHQKGIVASFGPSDIR